MSTILSIMKEQDNPTLFDIIKENPDITYNEAAKVQKDINLRNEESAAAIKGAGVCITAGMKRDRDATDKMKKKKLIPMTEEEHRTLNSEHQESLSYEFSYWGPLLFKVKLEPQDLKKYAQLCSKESSFVSDNLAGVIKHQHYISSQKFYDIIDPYLTSFRHCFQQWYGKPLHNQIMMTAAWVNFMTAGEFNPPHIHENCDFSSVLFVKVPEKLKEERKNFKGKGSGPGSLSFIYGERREYSIGSKSFFPEEGDLFIFPATLTHFVAPFMCSGERISISANFKLE